MSIPSDHPEAHADTVAVAARPGLRRPSMWNVVMVNDNFTPMEFVVDVLAVVFGKSLEQAVAVMLEVHNAGQAIVGTYTHEVAQAKRQETGILAEHAGHPLLVRLERAPGGDED